MTWDPNARFGTAPPPNPPPAPPGASFVPYLLAHLLIAVVLFVVMSVGDPFTFGDALDYLALHMPVPLLLSALLSWALSRRLRPPFWGLLLIAVPTYPVALFVYEMGLLMAATQR